MSFKNDLRIVWAEFKKSVKIWISYPIMLVFWAIAPFMWVLPFIFQGKALVGGLSSAAFKELTGSPHYLPFVLIGAMVSTYIFSGLWGVGNSLREETYWGTLEYIIVSPTNPIVVLLGKTLAEFVYATVNVTMQALVATFFLGLDLTLAKIFPVFVIVLLLLIGFYGFAIAFAGFTLLIKEAHGWVHTLEWVFYLFSPIRYPVEVSTITKTLSAVIPLTYALVAIRGIILLNKNILHLGKTILILIIMDIILLITGYLTFRYLERKTKEAGTLAQY
ncbi:MAG: ABC transporter permease [Candidatus Latescibacteria bacterium]|nr:ABC transporter permease [Candidatus Latescibacterota bacterium]